ncbi:MAG TPA: protein kinase [Pyrinomonadaceae bacterium]|nr:protein kinase [Pyrinomonadaceae bacterium]
MPFEKGAKLGRYEILSLIGAGGMGQVYLALDSVLGRHVAIKILSPEFASDIQRLIRFEYEAKAASALNHPNILTVYDMGEVSGTHFIVTEFVDGLTLRDWVQQAKPSLSELTDAIRQAAVALGEAHRAGIVHRDVKPENLMRRSDGFVKVLDFGIAKAIPTMAGAGAFDKSIPITATGVVVGTLRYMSPEQALGEVVDARTDVWSLGVVLYELIAGRPPFDDASPTAMLVDIVTGHEAALLSVLPQAPQALCSVIERAMRKNPGERFRDAAEMAQALEHVVCERCKSSQTGPTLVMTTNDSDRAQLHRRPAMAPTNLPRRMSELIGRERELAEVVSALLMSDEQLVTLTGPGGTGKTRLAFEVGRELHDCGDFSDGVIAVDLAPLSDPGSIVSHVAETLGVIETRGGSIANALAQHLSNKRLLLLLDNFEHLLDGAPLVSALIAASPGLKVLATSRSPLRLSHEREYAVEPLEVPAPASPMELDKFARVPAVRLFVERARQAKPSFELTHANANAVAEVCRKLNGLPLALELAAARVKLLTPTAMLKRLDHSLSLLTGGPRDLPARQQTMSAAVAWSYDLLTEGERAVLGRIAVFPGGCTLEAAEAVCRTGGDVLLQILESLVEKSLVRHSEEEDGESRFTMLEVVRKYAIEQLQRSGEAISARLLFAQYFKRLVEKADPEIRSGNQVPWVRRLSREHDNVKAAMTVLLIAEPVEGAAFVASMQPYWNAQAYSYSGRRTWYLKALEVTALPSALRSRLLNGLSRCESRLGHVEAAVVHGREAVHSALISGNRDALGSALSGLGNALSVAGDLRAAGDVFKEYVDIARELGFPARLSVALGCLGEVARMTGDLHAASAYYEEALNVAGWHVRSDTNAITLANLGGVSLEKGDYTAASGYYRQSLEIVAELENSLWAAVAINGLASIALHTGDQDKAALLAGAAEALCEVAGTPLETWEQSLRDRYVSALRSTLDAARLDREWARGRTMTLRDAAAAALSE